VAVDLGLGRAAILTRKIPKTGEAIPVIGLGTWQTFDVGVAASDRAPLRKVLETFYAGGGTVIDSSPMYDKAEGVSGDLVAAMGARARTFIATKVWIEGRERGVAQMENSFRLFKTDVIDLMQVHNLTDWRTQLITMREWKARGRFRYLGITHFTTSALTELARVLESEGDIDFVQFPYSIGVRDAERRLLPLCQDKGLATLINRPLEGGGLLRTIGKRDLPSWAAELDCASWAQFFLKYILGHPAVTAVIPATANPAHMTDDLKAGEGRLPDPAMRQKMVEYVLGV
jgi:diketogulonate reductase-like aldo/keto reductase